MNNKLPIFDRIDEENYKLMEQRVEKLSKDDTEIGSSNFILLIKNLSDSEDGWIDELNEFLG